MSNVNPLVRVVGSCALLWSLSVIPAAAQRISAELKTSQVTVQNGIADSTFRIEVKNDETTPIENVYVVFADDIQLQVGDVAGEGTATSEEMSRSFDISESPSENTPISITLKFSVDGEQVALPATVILRARQ